MIRHKEECFHLGVKALIVNPDKKLLLLQRDHPSKGVYWDIPGGRLQKGKGQMETLLREVKEETGLDKINDAHHFLTVITDIRIPTQEGTVGLIFSIYLLNLSASFIPALSDEHINFEWCSLREASERLKSQYPKEFIEKMRSKIF